MRAAVDVASRGGFIRLLLEAGACKALLAALLGAASEAEASLALLAVRACGVSDVAFAALALNARSLAGLRPNWAAPATCPCDGRWSLAEW